MKHIALLFFLLSWLSQAKCQQIEYNLKVLNAAGTLEDSLGLSNYIIGNNIDAAQMRFPIFHFAIIDWLGTPYKYGTATNSQTDCSGFVYQLLKQVFNIELERSSSLDLFKKCSPISKDDLKEGDLIFFKISKSRISHVGIYISNNKFVHASRKSGVIISDLNEPYYQKSFYKGGRLLL